jgi:hypothetical protein
MAVATSGDDVVLVAASYHDPRTGWDTRSRVFLGDARAGGAALRFTESPQRLDTHGCHDVELAWVGGELLLFLSEDRSPTSTRIASSLLAWDAAARAFVPRQRIPTDGAHGARLFEGPDGAPHLFVANFGDRLGKRVEARSALWRRRGAARQPRGAAASFELVAEVPSFGATDAEHFTIDGRHFIALANEGDIGSRRHQRSVIYELLAGDASEEREL